MASQLSMGAIGACTFFPPEPCCPYVSGEQNVFVYAQRSRLHHVGLCLCEQRELLRLDAQAVAGTLLR